MTGQLVLVQIKVHRTNRIFTGGARIDAIGLQVRRRKDLLEGDFFGRSGFCVRVVGDTFRHHHWHFELTSGVTIAVTGVMYASVSLAVKCPIWLG